MDAHQMPVDTQQELRRLPGNNRCVDCDAPYPQWATVSYGTFMCLECSGRHRGLGVHISFVRSVTMDSWTDKQVRMMQLGGNERFKNEFLGAGVPTTLSIHEKYHTPQAETYRQQLSARADGKQAPSLPRWDPSCMQSSTSSSSSGAFSANGDSRGVEALKGESEQDYVARQMRLKEEARARMQAKFGASGMQGIGSGGESSAPASASGIPDLSSAFGFLSTTVSSTVASAASMVKDQNLGNKVHSGWSYVQNTISDPALSTNVKSTASTSWSALSSGASAMWKSAQSVVETAVQAPGGGEEGYAFPRTNSSLPSSSKYDGIGSAKDVSAPARAHNNDSWLDAQLAPPAPAAAAAPVPSVKSLSGSVTASSSSSAPSSTTSESETPQLPVAAASAPAPPVAAPQPKKKDVDFFGEYGF